LSARVTLAFVAVFCGVLLSPDVVWSCSCDERKSVKNELRDAAAVFFGEVVDIESDPRRGKGFFTNDTVSFLVDVAWKGISTRKIRVMTVDDEGACGFPFVKGETYLVYAFECKNCPDGLSTHLCTRTTDGGRWDRIWLGAPEWKFDDNAK